MSETFIPKTMRDRVAAEALYRCGYCLTAQAIVGMPMEMDHLIPESVGGETVVENLWLACPLCNNHKANRIAAADPETGEIARLFDPRRQMWKEHFRWSEAGDHVVGTTVTGRATVAALQLNRAVRVLARRAWVTVGWHPPKD
jgi:hypothetical protein